MRGHDACNCVQQIASCGCQHCKTVGILPFHPAQNTRWPRQQDSPGRVAARREQTVRTPVLSSTLLLSDDVVDTISSQHEQLLQRHDISGDLPWTWRNALSLFVHLLPACSAAAVACASML